MTEIKEAAYRIITTTNRTFSSNSYFICHSKGDCIIIDPAKGQDFFKFLGECGEIDRIILTHEHYDHISGVEDIFQAGSPLLIRSDKWDQGLTTYESQIRVSDVYGRMRGSHLERLCRVSCPPADLLVDKLLEFEWNGLLFRLCEAPGHTDGSILIILDEKYLFCGDSLSEGKTVVTSLIGGNRCKYRDITLPLLDQMDSGYTVLPGHGSPFLLGEGLKNLYLNKYRNYNSRPD